MKNTSVINSEVTNVSYPSLCIPRIFSNIQKKDIFKVFKSLNIGYIERIDMITKTTDKGEVYKRAYIHFKYWYPCAENMRQRIINNEEAKIIYDEPWFWKVSKNHNKEIQN